MRDRAKSQCRIAEQNTWSGATRRRRKMTRNCSAPVAAVRCGTAKGDLRFNIFVATGAETITEMAANQNLAKLEKERRHLPQLLRRLSTDRTGIPQGPTGFLQVLGL